jgi:feruloyl esterase
VVAADVVKKTPAYCEVKGEISLNPKSHIGVVFRLPDNWNGRVLGIGGGWQGDTNLRATLPGLTRGYADVRGADGKTVVYGLARGGEPGWGVFVATQSRPAPLAGAAPAAGGNPLNAYIYGDAHYDEAKFDPVMDTAKVRSSAFAKEYESDDPDIRPFLAKGGKLILWHGLSDPGPSPFATAAYYDQVKTTTGANSAVRLFLAPGVSHCGGGTGAAPTDVLAAMDDWIATSKAPDVIPAANAPKGFTRPLCAWPALAFYKGEGDPNADTSFACRNTAQVRTAAN